MKRLTLVRHAKSSWSDSGLSDRERPLNTRGKADAPEMGMRYARLNATPDIIISSTAKRAFTTAKAIAKEIGYSKTKIKKEEQLYNAEVSDWIEFIQALETKHNHVMLFGHNPALTDLVNFLTGPTIDNLPTCGVVDLEYRSRDWKKITQQKPTSISVDFPKKRA